MTPELPKIVYFWIVRCIYIYRYIPFTSIHYSCHPLTLKNHYLSLVYQNCSILNQLDPFFPISTHTSTTKKGKNQWTPGKKPRNSEFSPQISAPLPAPWWRTAAAAAAPLGRRGRRGRRRWWSRRAPRAPGSSGSWTWPGRQVVSFPQSQLIGFCGKKISHKS